MRPNYCFVQRYYRTPTKGWNNTLCKDVGEGESNAEAADDGSTELPQDERQVHVAQPRVVHLRANKTQDGQTVTRGTQIKREMESVKEITVMNRKHRR